MSTVIKEQRQGWIRRNWKALAVWLGLALLGATIAVVGLRYSEATELSIYTAESNPVLRQQLGQPLRIGWFISGSIDVQPGEGHAELEIPISGTKGKGKIYSEVKKRAGVWSVQVLQLDVDGTPNQIDLLESTPNAPTSSPQH